MRALRTVITPLLVAGLLLSGCVPTAPVPSAPRLDDGRAGTDPVEGGLDTSEADAPRGDVRSGAPGRDAEADLGRCRAGDAADGGAVATIPLEHRPADLVLDPGGEALYTSSERDDVVSVVDTGSRAVVDTIRLPDRPYGLFLDAPKRTLYATLPGLEAPGGAIAVVDTARRELVRALRFADADRPTDAVVDPTTGLLFVVNSGADSVAVFSSITGGRIRSIPVDIDPIHVDVVAEAGVVLVSGWKGLVAIDARSMTVRGVLDLPGGALAIDHAAGDVFVANQGYGTLSIVDLDAFEVVGRVAVGGRGPFDVAFDADARLAYVTGTAGGELAIIDVATLRITERIAGRDGARVWYGAVAVDHTTNCVFAADLDSSSIVVLERRS